MSVPPHPLKGACFAFSFPIVNLTYAKPWEGLAPDPLKEKNPMPVISMVYYTAYQF